MRKIGMGLLMNLLWLHLFAQSKEFEGQIEYKADVKSKSAGITDKVMMTLLATGEHLTVSIKQGNYLLSSGLSDQYYNPKKERIYIKFRALDTLYYLNYSSDTSALLNVIKSNEEKTIAGQLCKSITIQTSAVTKKYFYAPALYMNAEYDRNNKVGRYDIYTKETNSIWLAENDEAQTYSLSFNCTRLTPKKIDDSVFDTPRLPEKEFSIESLSKPPEFSRSGGWIKYLTTNLNAELGAKYVRIPKGEKEGTETVIVLFLISEYGRVSNVQVINNKDIHPKLAEEAIRVISASPPWTPATIYGEKSIFWYKQPVTFSASK